MDHSRGDNVDNNFAMGAPTKFGRVKNVQNSALFVTTFDFDRKYLRKVSTYRKSDKYMINNISSPIGRNKLGELRSTNQKVIGAHVDPPNWTFFGRLYFGP